MPVRRLGRRALAAAASVVLSLLVVLAHGSAVADETYPPGPNVVVGTLSEPEVTVGEEVVISGGGFIPRSLLRLSVDGTLQSTFPAGTDGGFSVSVRMTTVGARSLAVEGREPGGRVRIVADPVIVLAGNASASDPQPSAPFAITPQRTGKALLGGLVLVIVAGGARLALRARRRPSPP